MKQMGGIRQRDLYCSLNACLPARDGRRQYTFNGRLLRAGASANGHLISIVVSLLIEHLSVLDSAGIDSRNEQSRALIIIELSA